MNISHCKSFLFLPILFALNFYGTAQVDVFNFHVKRDVMRMKLQNGKWGEWRPFSNINETLDQNITINLHDRQILWIIRYMHDEPSVHKYKILDVNQDMLYQDFGLWVLEVTCENEKNIQDYFRLGFVTVDNHEHYILLHGYDNQTIQSKLELEVK